MLFIIQMLFVALILTSVKVNICSFYNKNINIFNQKSIKINQYDLKDEIYENLRGRIGRDPPM